MVIAIVFFLIAANGFIHLAYGKPPIMQSPAHQTGAQKTSFYFVAYVRFYLLPFFWASIGWLLYKWGSKKVKSTVKEENESE